jgi:hypothetical protein
MKTWILKLGDKYIVGWEDVGNRRTALTSFRQKRVWRFFDRSNAVNNARCIPRARVVRLRPKAKAKA